MDVEITHHKRFARYYSIQGILGTDRKTWYQWMRSFSLAEGGKYNLQTKLYRWLCWVRVSCATLKQERWKGNEVEQETRQDRVCVKSMPRQWPRQYRVYGQINATSVTQTIQGLRTNQCHASDPDRTGFTGKSMPRQWPWQDRVYGQINATPVTQIMFTEKSMPRQWPRQNRNGLYYTLRIVNTGIVCTTHWESWERE